MTSNKKNLNVTCMPGVQVQELLESKTKTLTGSWDADTSGGSHLHPDWRKNPKFSLKVRIMINWNRCGKV